MRKNKKLKKIAEETLSRHTDKEFLDKLKAEVRLNRAEGAGVKKRSKNFYAVCAGLAVAACLIICLTVLFEFGVIGGLKGETGSPSQNKFYSADNMYLNDISLEEFNAKDTGIDLSDRDLLSVAEAVDVYYGETLYYIVKYNDPDTFDLLNFVVVTNPDYPYRVGETDYIDEAQIGGYSVFYTESIQKHESVYDIMAKGKIQTEKATVYIEYESVSLTEHSGFLEMLASCLVVSE